MDDTKAVKFEDLTPAEQGIVEALFEEKYPYTIKSREKLMHELTAEVHACRAR